MAGSYYYCYKEFHLICVRGCRSASENEDRDNIVFIQCLGFTNHILLHHALTDNHFVALTNIFVQKVYKETGFAST